MLHYNIIMGFIYIVVNKLKIPPAVIMGVYRRSTPQWPMPVPLWIGSDTQKYRHYTLSGS